MLAKTLLGIEKRMKLVCLKKKIQIKACLEETTEMNIRKEQKEGKYRKSKIKMKEKQQL